MKMEDIHISSESLLSEWFAVRGFVSLACLNVFCLWKEYIPSSSVATMQLNYLLRLS